MNASIDGDEPLGEHLDVTMPLAGPILCTCGHHHSTQCPCGCTMYDPDTCTVCDGHGCADCYEGN